MEKNIKEFKKMLKDNGVFYTDSKLASIIKDIVDVDYSEVYDPTCGQGNLLKVFDDEIIKYGQEIDENELQKCHNIPNFIGEAGDTLQDPKFIDKKFDCIVANYPFSIKRDPVIDNRFIECGTVPSPSRADYAFILHILYMLSNEGIAVTLNHPGILYRGNKEKEIRKRIIEKNYIDKIVYVEPGYFVDTNIGTVIITFKKNKTDKKIKLIDNDTGAEMIIEYDDIVTQDYDLSMGRYFIQKEVRKEVDPKSLMSQARNQFVAKLKKDIAFDKKVCELEGRDHGIYLDGLIKILQNSKNHLKK